MSLAPVFLAEEITTDLKIKGTARANGTDTKDLETAEVIKASGYGLGFQGENRFNPITIKYEIITKINGNKGIFLDVSAAYSRRSIDISLGFRKEQSSFPWSNGIFRADYIGPYVGAELRF